MLFSERKGFQMSNGICCHCGVKAANLLAHYEVAHKKQELAKKAVHEQQKQAQRAIFATNNVLLVFDDIEGATTTYLLNVTNEELVRLKGMHNGFYDVEDEDYVWLDGFLSQFEPLATTDDISEKAPALRNLDNITFICTGLAVGNATVDEDFESDDESEMEVAELPNDPKAYYFHAFTEELEPEDNEPGISATYAHIIPKAHFDVEKGFCNQFVADYLNLSDKFEELDTCSFEYQGTPEEATNELNALGMVANPKLID